MAQPESARKRLKSPDLFQRIAVQALRWLDQHQVQIFAVAGVIIIVALGVFGWRYYENRRTQQLFEEFAVVDDVYRAEQKKADEAREEIQKQITRLRNEINKAPDPKKAKSEDKPDSDPRLVALQDKLAAVSADHEGSLPQFVALYEKHPGDPVGWSAASYAIGIHLAAGRTAEAKDLLEKLLKSAISNPFYQVKARWSYVTVLEELGEWDKAIAEADTLLELAPDDLKPAVLLTKGRIQYDKEDYAAAEETFKKLMDAHKDAPETQTARALSALIQSQKLTSGAPG